MSINFDGNPCRFLTILLLRFVRFLKEKLNMMLLQESEKVNISRDVEQKMKFVRAPREVPGGSWGALGKGHFLFCER